LNVGIGAFAHQEALARRHLLSTILIRHLALTVCLLHHALPHECHPIVPLHHNGRSSSKFILVWVLW
jgi:hypothetical protein